ncbi:MAG: glycosyltransferase family 2 protein [Litorimonas sp.]
MTPTLSVLIPFYQDDPTPLLRSLSNQCDVDGEIEIRLMDDGSGDPALTRRVTAAVDRMDLRTTFTTVPGNRGRAATRNALQEQSEANWILFLDADMRIDHTDFLRRYLELIATDKADIVFGGFTVEDRALDRDTDLHRVLSRSSDCLDAASRNRAGPQFVASSNLCVRRRVLTENPFDPAFSGWGWEDSEWAARVGSSHRLVHIDNPAVHLGLESTDTLLSRFATSGPNYRRFVERHPELARSLPLFRIVTRLRHVPGHGLLRWPLKMLVKLRLLPTRLRVLALKLWRASHYAEAMR